MVNIRRILLIVVGCALLAAPAHAVICTGSIQGVEAVVVDGGWSHDDSKPQEANVLWVKLLVQQVPPSVPTDTLFPGSTLELTVTNASGPYDLLCIGQTLRFALEGAIVDLGSGKISWWIVDNRFTVIDQAQFLFGIPRDGQWPATLPRGVSRIAIMVMTVVLGVTVIAYARRRFAAEENDGSDADDAEDGTKPVEQAPTTPVAPAVSATPDTPPESPKNG